MSDGMDLVDLLQWPAMAVTLTASWLVASSSEPRRHRGFWVFLLSNVLWIAWGWHAHAWALITLQVGLAAMNTRGARKNRAGAKADERSRGAGVGVGPRGGSASRAHALEDQRRE